MALAAVGGWLSFYRLAVPSWGYDEPTYAAAGRAYSHGGYGPNPEHPPLVKYLIGASERAFGDTVTAARLPSALMLFCSGLLVWVWLRRTGPPGSGPVAALLIWSLPVLTGFPEALDRPPADQTLARAGMLDPVAGDLALAALGAVLVGLLLAAPAAVSAGLSIQSLATLRPTGYAALPGLVPAGSEVWVVGDPSAVRRELPGRQVSHFLPHRPRQPDAIVLDRGTTLRSGDRDLARYATEHHYRLVRTGPLDVWLRP